MRDFEKISFKQFTKDIKDGKKIYEEYKLPIRDSKATAGIILVVLSIILTLIGGILPSKKAAKEDPVLALRSE